MNSDSTKTKYGEVMQSIATGNTWRRNTTKSEAVGDVWRGNDTKSKAAVLGSKCLGLNI